MNVFAISDLHLSSSGEKPMDVFGPEWEGHADKIEAAWRERVGEDDLVLMPGDLSWAMRLDEALADLRWVEALPGIKAFVRGNHDYWFSSPGKVRAVLGSTMRVVRYDALCLGAVGICGVRGGIWPGHPDFAQERDRKHWDRAITRLGLSLDALAQLDWDVAVAMFHYPPLDAARSSELCEMVRAAGVHYVVYGHVHGEAAGAAFQGERDGVVYRCVSADAVGFAPAWILTT